MSWFLNLSRSNPPPVASQLTEPSPLRGTALTLGLIGAALALVAIVMVVWGSADFGTPTVGVLIRVAGILLAVSLVLPSFRKPSLVAILIASAGLILVLARPGLIWVALLGWVGWVVFGRQANR